MIKALHPERLPAALFRTLYTASILMLALITPPASAQDMDNILDMPLQALLDLEVTSVSRHEENLLTAPAAIHVITSQDIDRLGVTSLPEALRMVPGLHVASIDGNKWVVSSRGLSGRFANKLLVQIDGRSVYTQTFSGVYWDMQDLLLSDVDRIEVIRGPGAALWGANAVNGIINVITKPASETQGGQIEVGSGNQQTGLATARYGAEISDDTYGRVYLKGRDYASNDLLMGGADAEDDWRTLSAGFRVDGQAGAQDSWTLQGDIIQADESQIISTYWQAPPDLLPTSPEDNYDADGWNILARWNHDHADESRSTLQLYWDHTERDELYLGQRHETWDIDFQHRLAPAGRHTLTWGAGYRYQKTRFRNTFAVSSTRERQHSELYSAFLQDQIALSTQGDLTLTLGSKLEHNDFTGFEIQPSARLMWTPAPGHAVWSGVSRAVRTPSALEDSSQIVFTNLPVTVRLEGSPDFSAEKLTAWELGYRFHGHSHFTLDSALFYNEYDDYLSLEPVSPTRIVTSNLNAGHSYGAEVSAIWQVTPDWQLKANYSYINVDITPRPGSLDRTSAIHFRGSSPQNMYSVQSITEVDENLEFNAWIYYVDNIPFPSSTRVTNNIPVDSYTSVNARLAWYATPDLELSFTVNNLFDNQQLEYVSEFLSSPTEVRRSLFARARWQF